MGIHKRLLSAVGVRRSISGIGLLLLTGFIVWAIYIVDSTNIALLIQNTIVVGIPSLMLLYGGRWLKKTDLHPDTYIYVSKWCNIGIAVMNGLLALVILLGSPTDIFQQILMLTGIGGAAGFGIGVNQARAYTKAREVEEQYKELEQERNMREQIFKTSPVGISVIDPDGSIRLVNDRLAEMSGRSKEKITDSDYDEPAFKARDENGEQVKDNSVFKEVLETGEPVYNKERQFETANGQKIWLTTNAAPIFDDSGEIDRVVVAMEDITDRKELEDQLRKERDQSQKMTQSMIDAVENYAIFRLEPDGTVATWNKGAENLKGYKEGEIIGEHFSKFYTKEDRESGAPEKNLEKATKKGRTHSQGWRVRKDGTRFWADVTIQPIKDDGEVTGFIKITEDITEKHQQEQEMERRLEEFSSIVSHDLKSPLNIAKGYLNLAIDSKDEEDLQKAMKSMNNMSQVIEDTRIITLQPDDIQKQELSLERTFIDSYKMVRSEDSSHSVKDAEINASDAAIKRLFANLIENSIQHNTEPVHTEAGPLENGEGFYYEDDGKGMNDETREKVLEKGFTTSETGSGLGLYITRRVAELHNWDLYITESENGGARFEFYI